MMTEPKLLTEAEWVNLIGLSAWSKAQGTIRERGMIAPEPVDPLLVEAAALVQSWCGQEGAEIEDLALAALRRGKELAERPTLTAEKVREAVEAVQEWIEAGGFTGSDVWDDENLYTVLSAALVERLK